MRYLLRLEMSQYPVNFEKVQAKVGMQQFQQQGIFFFTILCQVFHR